jgi:hypothetical protein
MSVQIIKPGMPGRGPRYHAVCGECGTEFTFQYEDQLPNRHTYFGQVREVTCPLPACERIVRVPG